MESRQEDLRRWCAEFEGVTSEPKDSRDRITWTQFSIIANLYAGRALADLLLTSVRVQVRSAETRRGLCENGGGKDGMPLVG